MGLNREFLAYIESSVSEVLGGLPGRSMLELGDQVIFGDEAIPEKTGKEYFRNRGVRHVSIDLNGCNGALPYDLRRPIPLADLPGTFDIITNSGTTEHVEPHEGQYDCYQNIHNLLSPGGIAIHLVPDIVELRLRGSWKSHCNNYYSDEFFRMLAEQNGYRLVSSRVIQGLRCSCLQKTSDRPFMSDRRLFLSFIARKSGGAVYVGINDSRFMRPFHKAARTGLEAARSRFPRLVNAVRGLIRR